MFSDEVGNLLSQSLGTRYLKAQQFAQNIVDWSLADQGLLSIRSRDRFARTLAPMSRQTEEFWEYLNYAAALGGLVLVWAYSRKRRRTIAAQHQLLLAEV